MQLGEERTRVENALRESRREEHQTVERMCEEAWSFASHEGTPTGWPRGRLNDLYGSLNDANAKNAELEHILHEYWQRFALM